MRTLIKVGLSLLLLAFVLIGASYSMLRSQGVSGAGAGRDVRSETRPLGKNIVNLELNGPIDVTVRQGMTPLLTVRGEQRLLPNIDTNQDGATLRIGPRGMLLHHRHPLQVEVVLPNLEQLEVHGSGDSTVNGFSGERFTLRLRGTGNVSFNGRYRQLRAGVYGGGDLNLNGGNSDLVELEMFGSGRITASGSVKTLHAELSGTGDMDAEHLAADKASVALEGAGTASVFARRAVAVSLRGSGDVEVHGNPMQRKLSHTGSGQINWR
ncbi:MAG TPA: DUF2807 domain-containing protein [Janthinobacterium sp.]|nr:DUF2807 domain-containing protein [Janthinobacterium sp.]